MVKAERILTKTVEQKVLGFIDQHKLISAKENILVAFSGGPDSVFILYFLNKYRLKFDLCLAAAHINHCLRGSNSDGDEVFCKDFAQTAGIQFFSKRVDVKKFAKENKLSVEEAARNVRYNVLNNIAENNRFNKIVTAHNMSDNAETVLLNLIKGTGLKGVCGIPPQRGKIIRPALSLSKQEILDYLHCLKISYRIDESNLSNDYERNFIRNILLPQIKNKLNPSVESSLFNSSENFRYAREIIEEQVEQAIPRYLFFSDDIIRVNIDSSASFNSALLGEILKKAVEDKFNIEFGFKDFLKIRTLIGKQPGRRVMLSEGVVAVRERNTLFIFRDFEEKFEIFKIRIGESKKINGKYIYIRETQKEKISSFNSDNYHELIAADGLDEEFELRRWMPGDKFIPLGMKSFKKISDFLGDQKILVSEKKKQLVLTNRNQIVWVPGFRIDDRYRITEKSKRILEICLE